MKRLFFTALAGMVSFMLLGAITVQAADVKLGGEFQPRYEARHQSDSTGGINDEVIRMRSRLNASAKIDDNTSAFLQFQLNNTWGGDGTGTAFNPNAANDKSTQVGMHQAYFTLKNFAGAPVDVQIGRQEVILDAHRLFGNTLWTQGAQSHDALRLTHKHDNMTLAYVYSKAVESAGGQDETDVTSHIVWGNFKGLVGDNSSTSVYLVNFNDNRGGANNDAFWTIGARQAGGMGDISYRGEAYYQTGKANGGANDLDAFMLGLRVGYKASQVSMKPSITLWGDYLSGTDLSDASGDKGAFNTLYDTGHKFYGLADYFLAQQQQGLIDLAIKGSIQPMKDLTVKAAFHHFTRAEDDAAGNDALGQELDITVVHKYSANLKTVMGFSYFMGDDDITTQSNIGNYDQTVTADRDQTWVYVWMILNF